MLKKISCFLLLFGALPLLGEQQQFPYFIDFSSNEFATHFYGKTLSPEDVTTSPFNGALEMSTFFMYVKDEYCIQTAIETGTFQANTTPFFATLFDVVHTIEIIPEWYTDSEALLRQFPNVHCHLGSSPIVLEQLLPTLANQRILFYLDAHWGASCPLLDELTEISKTHQDNCIIVLDDFKVPGRPDIPYDGYNNNEYTFEYVQSYIDQIFQNGYTIHYLIPKNVSARAKLVAIPKKWSER